MTGEKRLHLDDVPEAFIERLRAIALGLPETFEEKAWVGTRWRIRTRTFAHVLGVQVGDQEPFVTMTFRAADEDLDMLRHAGHPFYLLGWGRNAMGMVLDDATDWDEVGELVTESYCLLAPKKLATLVDRPELPEPPHPG